MSSISLYRPIIKTTWFHLVFVMAFSISAFAHNNNGGVSHPVYPPKDSDIDALKKSVEPLMRMSIEEVIAEVPAESGIFFIGCPNCHGGSQESHVLAWKPGMKLKVRCNYCGMVFPNKKFPNNREKLIIAPSGARQVYRYYEDSTGYPYYFEGHALYEKWLWIRPLAEKLARLWYMTKDNAYGDRAAAIAGRFAQLFPDYAVRYDFPNAPVQFFPANQKWPYKGLEPYRGAKWSWWGYVDIPTYLARVYDILMSGYDWNRMNGIVGHETDKRIASDLIRLGYEFTTANPEVYSNMSAGMYANMIRAGRILGDPSMVHEAVERFRGFFSKGFFADGWWREGAPSYHEFTITSLEEVVKAMDGYVDPPEWKGERFNHYDLIKEIPLFNKAFHIINRTILPNGRKIPVNDTWPYARRIEKTDSTISRLWPAVGDAAIGTGQGEDQVMLNVNWSGNYGHSHYDNGSIILYALGQELLSDIGYTHSKYRPWTTHTASHNTVVIDQMSQDVGSKDKPVTGRLKFYDDKDSHVKVVDVDASPAYSVADVYRRRLIMVHAGEGFDYVLDRFDVKGGNVHDWFLHGMCEHEGTLKTSISLDQPLKTLVPEWGGNKLPETQKDMDRTGERFHSYAFLLDIKKGAAIGSWSATWRYDSAMLRSHILSQPLTEVFRFRSPSIRPANEDNNKLEDYMRSGVMQRHRGGSSTFIAVHEPFRNDPWIESVKQENGAIIVWYKLNGVDIEDKITLNDEGVSVSSSAGWKYHSGTAISGEVRSLRHREGKWILVLDRQAPEVNYIRLDFSDGGTYYCPVESVQGNKLELKNDPGFSLNNDGKVQFHTFPNDQYNAPLRYTLFIKKTRKSLTGN